uniref:Uncharacterized protein n=1 Tax=Cacopsylla melanoneura TaxID=428564 RepID=A0A8D8XLQ9_9HEMI
MSLLPPPLPSPAAPSPPPKVRVSLLLSAVCPLSPHSPSLPIILIIASTIRQPVRGRIGCQRRTLCGACRKNRRQQVAPPPQPSPTPPPPPPFPVCSTKDTKNRFSIQLPHL